MTEVIKNIDLKKTPPIIPVKLDAQGQKDLSNTLVKEVIKAKNGNETVKTYMIGKLLGKGGFAKVYEIRSLDQSDLQAVKVVPKSQLEKPRSK